MKSSHRKSILTRRPWQFLALAAIFLGGAAMSFNQEGAKVVLHGGGGWHSPMSYSAEVVTERESVVYGWIYFSVGMLFLLLYVRTLVALGGCRRFSRFFARRKARAPDKIRAG